MKACYFVSCHTKILFNVNSYQTEAAKMADMLHQVFSSSQSLGNLSKTPLSACHTEIEISRDPRGLIGKCVVDMEGEKRPTLDKGKLSTVLKAFCPPDWPALKIEKRSIELD